MRDKIQLQKKNNYNVLTKQLKRVCNVKEKKCKYARNTNKKKTKFNHNLLTKLLIIICSVKEKKKGRKCKKQHQGKK